MLVFLYRYLFNMKTTFSPISSSRYQNSMMHVLDCSYFQQSNLSWEFFDLQYKFSLTKNNINTLGEYCYNRQGIFNLFILYRIKHSLGIGIMDNQTLYEQAKLNFYIAQIKCSVFSELENF